MLQPPGDIYSLKGRVIVMSFRLHSPALCSSSRVFKSMDNALVEAGEGLGRTGPRRLFNLVRPLMLSALLAGAPLAFMRSFADYGPPMPSLENCPMLPVLAHREFLSEIGGSNGMAAATPSSPSCYDKRVFAAKTHRQPQGVFHRQAVAYLLLSSRASSPFGLFARLRSKCSDARPTAGFRQAKAPQA